MTTNLKGEWVILTDIFHLHCNSNNLDRFFHWQHFGAIAMIRSEQVKREMRKTFVKTSNML